MCSFYGLYGPVLHSHRLITLKSTNLSPTRTTCRLISGSDGNGCSKFEKKKKKKRQHLLIWDMWVDVTTELVLKTAVANSAIWPLTWVFAHWMGSPSSHLCQSIYKPEEPCCSLPWPQHHPCPVHAPRHPGRRIGPTERESGRGREPTSSSLQPNQAKPHKSTPPPATRNNAGHSLCAQV